MFSFEDQDFTIHIRYMLIKVNWIGKKTDKHIQQHITYKPLTTTMYTYYNRYDIRSSIAMLILNEYVKIATTIPHLSPMRYDLFYILL